jgi:uncharacterized coiled-coil protein SlyX
MTSEKDDIQKRIIDLELISTGYDELFTHVIGDKEWRRNLVFIKDFETTVRERQKKIMEELNNLITQRSKEGD